MNKKIVFIDVWQELAPRRQREIKTLLQAGYKIHIIAWDRVSKGQKIERNDNIVIETIGIPSPIADFKAVFRLPLFYMRAWNKLMDMKFDVIHCCHLMVLPLSVIIGKIKGVRVIYDAIELYVVVTHYLDSMPAFGRYYVGKLIEFAENKLVSLIDGVLTIDTKDDVLLNRYSLFNSNVESLLNTNDITNLCLENETTKELEKLYTGNKIIIYAGRVVEYAGVLKAVEAMNILRKRFSNVKLLILGSSYDGTDKVISDYIKRWNLEQQVELIDFMPYERMLAYLRSAHIALAPYQPIPAFLVARGNAQKIFDYMFASLPIIAPSYLAIGDIVSREQCGILVDTTNPEAIAQALIFLLENEQEARAMGLRGRKAIETKYNWEIESRKLLKVYETGLL